MTTPTVRLAHSDYGCEVTGCRNAVTWRVSLDFTARANTSYGEGREHTATASVKVCNWHCIEVLQR